MKIWFNFFGIVIALWIKLLKFNYKFLKDVFHSTKGDLINFFCKYTSQVIRDDFRKPTHADLIVLIFQV